MRKLIPFILLLSASLTAQVPNPGTPMGSRIGPGGIFPLFNGGTLTIGDADNTSLMTQPPNFTALVLKITSSVPLTATRTITFPSTMFGFEFTIQNATSGGHDIIIKGAGGTGATIPNQQTMMVLFDGTNYVTVGAASGGAAAAPGFNVPVNYPTVQAAVNAATTASSGPVTVMPEATDRSPFTNPNGVRVSDYRQRGGIDTRFSRDVSEWGVKGDGKIVSNCTTTAGSNVINCLGANFQPTDVNKLIIVYNAGPPSGAVNPDLPVTIISAPTVAPNMYYVGINADTSSGCDTLDTQPYVWFRADGTGTIVQQGWYWTFFGEGCIHPPTTWTLAPVYQGLAPPPGAVVTISGGGIFAEDQPSTIQAVNSPTQVTVADNMTITATTSIIYGSDDKNPWTTACNAMKDVAGAASSNYSHGTLTFTGTSLVSAGIDCNGSNMWIVGSGYMVLGESNSSILVYAGKTPAVKGGGGYLLRLAGGTGMRISRMGFRGNTFAPPYLLTLAFGPVNTLPSPAANVGTATTGSFEDLSFGFMYGDRAGTPRPGAPYSAQSCIFADTNVGNVDFNEFDRIFCRGAVVGVDGNNNQATNWKIGTWHSENNKIGYAVGGETYFLDYYNEHNWLDVMLGSPTNVVWYPVRTVFESLVSETSAESIRMSPLYNSALLEVRHGGANPTYIGPHGIAIDLGRMNQGVFKYNGSIPGKLILQRSCYGGPAIDIETDAPYASTVVWWNLGWAANCTNLKAPYFSYRYRRSDNALNITQTEVNSFPNGVGPSSTVVSDTLGGQQVYGSVKVSAATAPGDNSTVGSAGNGLNNYITATAVGTGSTIYRYQITCKDGLGRETGPNPVTITLNNATPLNATTNYNQLYNIPHRGCASYCYYSDEGSGGALGQLACVDQTAIPKGYFFDQGQYTPSSITPPVVSQSGLIEGAGYTVLGQPFAGFKVPQVTTYYTQGIKLKGSQQLSDFSGKSAARGLIPIFDGTEYVPGSLVPSTAGVINSLAGQASQGGYTTIGYSTQSSGQILSVVFYQAFVPAASPPIQALQVTGVKMYNGSLSGGKVFAAIYDSDGVSGTGTPNAPGKLLCGDLTGTVVTANAWNTISSLDVTTCPYLTVGHKYFVATMNDGSGNVMYHTDGFGITGNSYQNSPVIGMPCCFFRLDANYSAAIPAYHSQYVDMTTVPTFGTFDASNPIPSSYLGTGTVGTGSNCLTDTQVWAPCSAGSGGGNVWFISNTYPMSTTVGAAIFTQTMVTPTTDSNYYLTWQLQQVDTGSGGTCNAGAFGVVLGFTEAVSNAPITAYISGRAFNAPGGTNSFSAGTTVDATNYFVGFPFEFTAKGNSPVTFSLTQTTASNCSTGQQFALRAHLKAW